jgi:hypothetical protein
MDLQQIMPRLNLKFNNAALEALNPRSSFLMAADLVGAQWRCEIFI